MGACVSRPEGCVKRRSKTRKRRKVGIRRKGTSRKSDQSLGRISDRSYTNPTFQGCAEEAWFDSVPALDSDCEEDFQSVHDDNFSLNSCDGASISSYSSLRDASHGDQNENVSFVPPNTAHRHKLDESSIGNSARDSVSDMFKSSTSKVSHSDDADLPTTSNATLNHNNKLHFDETSSHSVDGREEGRGVLDNCGILPNNCLPRLNSNLPSLDKRRPLSPTSPSARKKTPLKMSFKWKEGHASHPISSKKMVLQRPLAGTQVPFCPIEKKMFNCWSTVEPGSFKVRGANYLKDKKKEFAPDYAAYYPFGVDVFLSQRKIDHIARFVELPAINSSGKLPTILVVNVQVPVYPATIFQGEADGEGMSFVLYFRLSESYCKELPPHFQENLRRIIDDEVEKVKGFTADTIQPVRERLKILGRVANGDELQLNAAQRKIMHAYNEKPVLSRPQHEFYSGENYFEVDIDMHRFGYISRKGFDSFLDRLKMCVLDVGLTIQGNKAEELPEQILCCIRLNGIDHINYHQLSLNHPDPP